MTASTMAVLRDGGQGYPSGWRPGDLGDPARLSALRGSGLMGDAPEEAFDRVARLASAVLGCPVAIVTLLDADTQYVKACAGPVGEGGPMPVARSLCRRVVESGVPLVLPDAAGYPRADGAVDLGGLGVGAYLGVPLAAPGGEVLGALCVVSPGPRAWSGGDVDMLREMAAMAMLVVRLRVETNLRAEAEALLVERQVQLERTLEAATGIGTWTWDACSATLVVDANLARIMGLEPDGAATRLAQAGVAAMVHEGDRAAFEGLWSAAGGCEPLSREIRFLRPDGGSVWVQWTSGGRRRPADGARVSGVAVDVTTQKAALEHQEGISGELAHRVKNMMATVQAVVTQTLRESTSLAEARESCVERLHALARAHDLLVSRGWEGAPLEEVVSGVASMFGTARFDLSGPPVALSPRRTLAISMALHELATNAAKHGALSNGTGRVSLAWERPGDGALGITWSESGGPAVAKPTREGFGSRLLHRLLSAEVGGLVETQFRPEGLVCRISGTA